MSKHWKEQKDPDKHHDLMSTTHIGGIAVKANEKEPWMYLVRECSFTFQFASLDQLRAMIAYVSVKVHPARRSYNNGIEHYWQHWYERLPKGLLAGPKREKFRKALLKALAEFEKE